MKKYRLESLLLTIIFILSLISNSSCTQTEIIKYSENITNPAQRSKSTDKNKSSNADISQVPLSIQPNDYISMANIPAQEKKAYTVLIYMNGSDLESDYMAATIDINEMIESKFDEKNINLVIFTGGARKWHTEGIPNKDNAIFKLENGKLHKLAQIGRDPMGYPETLCGFINFGYNIFPADKYSLIFWNHGGGAIVGYGSDERYEQNPNKAMMKLAEIDSALANNDLCRNGKNFEFIGFDTCLMATLEMACIASNYANYMIASEELEPDGGWDYNFLRDIKPGTSGKDAGISIVDYYANFYLDSDIEDILTISVTDLSKIEEVAHNFENLAIAGRNEIAKGNYHGISRARNNHRSFGSRGEFSDETDMIDAANLAKSLGNLLPGESNALIQAINNAVIYKYETNIEELGGLSVYFPFANKTDLAYYMEVYRSINQLPEYVGFIDSFCVVLDSEPFVSYRGIASSGLSRENIINSVGRGAPGAPAKRGANSTDLDEDYKIVLTPEQLNNLAEIHQTTWKKSKKYNNRYIQIEETRKVSVKGDGTVEMNFSDDCTTLNGHIVCLYETAPVGKDGARYSIPVKLNGEDADLIAVYCEKYPNGKIIGAIPEGEDIYNILDKKIVRLRKGDKIQILYYSEPFGEYTESMNDGKEEIWQKGEEFTIMTDNGADLILSKEPLSDGEYIYGLNFVDLQQNKYYSNFLSVGIK
ncbi:MAG: clostripain-related cysteine peptidase [Oscillospiraceae bacterium]|nr:clostripain-related cysteine peptidase [Oscillospiraceae bacterium]